MTESTANQPPPPLPTLALVSDLLFSSKITAEARAKGVAVKIVRQPAALAGLAGRALLVDLNLPGAMPAAAAWGDASGQRVIGFVSHSDHQTISEARRLGIDAVPRSRFVQILPELLGPPAPTPSQSAPSEPPQPPAAP